MAITQAWSLGSYFVETPWRILRDYKTKQAWYAGGQGVPRTERLVIYTLTKFGQVTMISHPYHASHLISQYIRTVDTAADRLIAKLCTVIQYNDMHIKNQIILTCCAILSISRQSIHTKALVTITSGINWTVLVSQTRILSPSFSCHQEQTEQIKMISATHSSNNGKN